MPQTGSVKKSSKGMNTWGGRIAEYCNPKGPSRTQPKGQKLKAPAKNIFKQTERASKG